MKQNIIFCIIIIALLLSGWASWNSFFKNYLGADTVDIHSFPKTIGPWSSEELTITEREYAILETKNAFARVYRTESGEEVYFFTVYSERNRKVSHPPEICYTGNGLLVLEKKPHHIEWQADSDQRTKQIPVMRLILEQGAIRQVSNYWFKVGAEYTNQYWWQQILLAWKNLMQQPSSSALIRVSATVTKGRDDEATQVMIENFIRDIYPYLSVHLPDES